MATVPPLFLDEAGRQRKLSGTLRLLATGCKQRRDSKFDGGPGCPSDFGRQMRSYRILVLLSVLLILVPFLTHYYMSKVFLNGSENLNNAAYGKRDPFDSRMVRQMYNLNDVEALEKMADLKFRVKEMLRIRGSVSNELKSLESRRQKLHSEISQLSSKLDEMKLHLSKKQMELRRVHVSLEQAKYSQVEANMKNPTFIARPLNLVSHNSLDARAQAFAARNGSLTSWRSCQMDNCFNYTRCSLLSGFPVYFYHPDEDENHHGYDLMHKLKSSVLKSLSANIHATFDHSLACIYIVLLFNHHSSSIDVESYLHNLPYWNDGQNHVIFNLISDYDLIDNGVDTKKAILVQDTFYRDTFRLNYDINIPLLTVVEDKNLPPHCPARRKYLASFVGSSRFTSHPYYSKISSVLKMIASESIDDRFMFDVSCTINCSQNKETLLESTFTLVIADDEFLWNQVHSENLVAVITAGAVPVLIAGSTVRLPFEEVIDWNLALVRLPLARVTELHYLLKSFADNDILAMRRQGRLFYERYLSSSRAIIETVLAVMRQKRLQIPAPSVSDVPTSFLFNNSFPMKYFDPIENFINPESAEPDENLGPLEPPFTTLPFQRNYSLTVCNAYQLWNSFKLNPFYLYPSTPFDPVLPSEAKFLGSSFGFRPIGGGVGGAGKEFSESLGGNFPREQFTIVILTYEREAVLIDSLIRLKGLPHLNKIVVIWNNPERMPSVDLKWPDVGVPLQVVKSDVNSLNNRFKPYDAIQTEAVLSMDDDAHLRHDEIIFGFRVWREARDRIVGFPGRYHAWESSHNGWLYNSNYSCELSMVLTGAAFFHKYYAYLYTYSMASSIRAKVDEYMNCEDIAMNFLVSHVTRKPPLKVTSRWTFRCPGCPISLSEDDSHFQERHRCINFFTRVYGYNPLLNTQFRADSVLFKTRIPHDKQKCFKFI